MDRQEHGPAKPEPLPLGEAARRILDEGCSLAGQLAGFGQALGELARAELALSRSALVRITLLSLLILLLAVSAWACLLVAVVLGLHALGCPGWLAALLVLLLLSGSAWFCLAQVRRLLPDLGFRHSKAALRQLLATANNRASATATEENANEPS